MIILKDLIESNGFVIFEYYGPYQDHLDYMVQQHLICPIGRSSYKITPEGREHYHKLLRKNKDNSMSNVIFGDGNIQSGEFRNSTITNFNQGLYSASNPKSPTKNWQILGVIIAILGLLYVLLKEFNII